MTYNIKNTMVRIFLETFSLFLTKHLGAEGFAPRAIFPPHHPS